MAEISMETTYAQTARILKCCFLRKLLAKIPHAMSVQFIAKAYIAIKKDACIISTFLPGQVVVHLLKQFFFS